MIDVDQRTAIFTVYGVIIAIYYLGKHPKIFKLLWGLMSAIILSFFAYWVLIWALDYSNGDTVYFIELIIAMISPFVYYHLIWKTIDVDILGKMFGFVIFEILVVYTLLKLDDAISYIFCFSKTDLIFL